MRKAHGTPEVRKARNARDCINERKGKGRPIQGKAGSKRHHTVERAPPHFAAGRKQGSAAVLDHTLVHCLCEQFQRAAPFETLGPRHPGLIHRESQCSAVFVTSLHVVGVELMRYRFCRLGAVYESRHSRGYCRHLCCNMSVLRF